MPLTFGFVKYKGLRLEPGNTWLRFRGRILTQWDLARRIPKINKEKKTEDHQVKFIPVLIMSPYHGSKRR